MITTIVFVKFLIKSWIVLLCQKIVMIFKIFFWEEKEKQIRFCILMTYSFIWKGPILLKFVTNCTRALWNIFSRNVAISLKSRFLTFGVNSCDFPPIFKKMSTFPKQSSSSNSITTIHDREITSRALWNCHFRGHLIITPSLT